MVILTPANWMDYELLDSGHGKRLERFGKYVLVRPDPQCLWKPSLPTSDWQKADAVFDPSISSGRGTDGREKAIALSESSSRRGKWVKKNNIPNSWQIAYHDLQFAIHLSPFKHTGVFPEQAVHWEFIREVISGQWSVDSKKQGEEQGAIREMQHEKQVPVIPAKAGIYTNNPSNQPKVLNLFGYTGIASLAAASAGAEVTHIDASYPTIGWAKENQKLSGLEKKPIRWILDDCLKFVEREIRRGNKYQGIIMDPPVYGHGPKGEKWDFNVLFSKLLASSFELLDSKKLFFIVNAYAVSASSVMLENMLKDYFKDGTIESGELALEEKSGRKLSTGIFARWSA